MPNIVERIKNWRNIAFVKDAAMMQAGAVFSTGLNIAASVIFARILMPEQYGFYVLVFAFAGLLFLFMNLGADTATLILLAEAYAKKDKEEIKNILTYFLKMCVLISVFVGGVAVLISPVLSKHLYGNADIGHLVRVVIFTYIISLFFILINIILQALRKIRNSVLLSNLQEFLKVLFSVSMILFGYGVLGVIIGQLFSAILMLLISAAVYKFYISKDSLFPGLRSLFLNWKSVPIRKYFKFGFLIATDQNVSRLYFLLPVLFLGMFFASDAVGYFNIAYKYITLPLLLLSPVGQLLNVRFPQLNVLDRKLLKRNFFKVSVVSGLIAVCLTVPVLVVGPFLIKLLYGTRYLHSISLIYYLVPVPILSGFAVGLGSMFRSLKKVHVAIIINAAIIGLGIAPAFYLIKSYGTLGISVVVVFWMFASLSVGLLYISKFLK